MTRQIDSLLRLNQWELDEKRRRLGEAQAVADAVRQEQQDLEKQVVEEQKFAAAQDGIASFGYGEFANRVLLKREELEKRLADAENVIAAIREEVAESFREQKKYEKAKEILEQEAALEAGRKEQVFLDELAQTQHRHKS